MITKIKKSEYQNYADCIRSDQVSAPEIVKLFEDKAFYKWYKKKYLLTKSFISITKRIGYDTSHRLFEVFRNNS